MVSTARSGWPKSTSANTRRSATSSPAPYRCASSTENAVQPRCRSSAPTSTSEVRPLSFHDAARPAASTVERMVVSCGSPSAASHARESAPSSPTRRTESVMATASHAGAPPAHAHTRCGARVCFGQDGRPVSSIVVSELEYAPPGVDSLFFDVGFGVAPGEHAALVGANGVGKSTILRILSGELEADEGEFALGGTVLTMTQDVGMSRPTDTLRDMLDRGGADRRCATPAARWSPPSGRCYDGTDDGMQFAEAITHWGDMGGYELEAQWAAAARRSVKTRGRRLLHAPGQRALRRRAQAPGARPAAQLRRRHPAARRARQLPRHPHPRVAGGADQGVQEHDPDGQPRPHPARAGGHQDHRHRGLGLLGARRFVRHVPRGAREAPGTAGRRAEAVERRRTSPVPAT